MSSFVSQSPWKKALGKFFKGEVDLPSMLIMHLFIQGHGLGLLRARFLWRSLSCIKTFPLIKHFPSPPCLGPGRLALSRFIHCFTQSGPCNSLTFPLALTWWFCSPHAHVGSPLLTDVGCSRGSSVLRERELVIGILWVARDLSNLWFSYFQLCLDCINCFLNLTMTEPSKELTQDKHSEEKILKWGPWYFIIYSVTGLKITAHWLNTFILFIIKSRLHKLMFNK